MNAYAVEQGGNVKVDLATRFMSKTCPEPNSGCLLWTACTSRKGYGQIRVDGRNRIAPSCVEPTHLFLGTAADNARDRDGKGRGNRGVKNGMARLDAEAVRSIRALIEGGTSQVSAAAKFGVSQSIVSNIVSRRRWDHVDPIAA